ncbi:MAG: hypothetical protein J6J15_04130 [Oscillospiraceae bacterium]|nr:hypothetical protein [Oscillospiraceae bacterium]MBR3597850.1 hypothetical protein [Clostridia bacterium]
MKKCPECCAIFEDSIDVCPTCGEQLENYVNSSKKEENRKQEKPQVNDYINSRQRDNNAYVFERNIGNDVEINGSVVESSTQQYYQSKFTKIVQALFSGEPYQLSHTTFVTVFRVEEHTTRGYPERARDITLYGNMQNIFAVGDDVTVTASRKGNRYVAKNVYNHSINEDVRIQPYISAAVIRTVAIIIAALVLYVIIGLLTADYAAIGASIMNFFVSLLPLGFGIWILWYLLKGLFKK